MILPFFAEMAASDTVLLAGAGGGYDVFAALPLYFWLRSQGKTVHLASLSFSNLAGYVGERPTREILKVTGATKSRSQLFPELALCQWLVGQGIVAPVYTFPRSGVRPASRAYAWMAKQLAIDTIVVVDGGTDILMRGDEPGLGTPEEDVASLLAAEAVPGVERKYVLCVGFGVDAYHGVSHVRVLENIASLIEGDGYLGAWSLTKGMAEMDLYRSAVRYATSQAPLMPSIVNSSIVAATDGWFGDRHFSTRTENSELFLNPLMSLFWAFRLEAVASNLLYKDLVRSSEDYFQLSHAIEKFRDALPEVKPWSTIPH